MRLAVGAAALHTDRCHSLPSLDSATGGGRVAPQTLTCGSSPTGTKINPIVNVSFTMGFIGAVKQSESEPSLPSGNARYATEFVTHCLQMLSGAGNRTRTGTPVTARDFKSLVSTYSTTPACAEHNNIFCFFSQVLNIRPFFLF